MNSPSKKRKITIAWIVGYLVFLALLLACFSPVLIGKKLLAPMDIVSEMYLPWRGDKTMPKVHNHFVSDAVTQYIPYRWFAHQSIQRDGFVGWNNLNYCGTPQYANTMNTSFDWTIQLHRWLGFWDAWHLGIFLQFLLAGWGMMFFLRDQGLSPATGLLGAICYAGNFQFVTWIYHRWALGSFCWMPLLLWTLSPLLTFKWDDRRSWRTIPIRTLFSPFLLCAAFFGGTLQHAAFIVIAVVCLGLAAAAQTGYRPLAWIRCLATFAILGLLGVSLAWIMFEPCIASLQANQSATSRVHGYGYLGGILQPLFNLVVYPFYAFPWPLGAPTTLDLWKFFKTDLFNLPFIGFLPAGLTVAGLFSKRVPLAPKFLMAAGFLIPLTPLVAFLYHRIYLVGILGAVWSACVFVDRLDRGEARFWARLISIVFGAFSFCWLLVGAIVLWKHAFLGAKLAAIIGKSVPAVNFTVFPAWYLSRGESFLTYFPPWSATAIVPWLLALGGCALCLVYAFGQRLSRSSLIYIMAFLAFAELSLLASRWVTFSPRESSPASAQAASSDLYPSVSIIDSLRNSNVIRLYTDPSLPFSIPFPPNILGTYSIATLRGYDSVTDKVMDGVAVSTESSPRLSELAITHALVGKPLSDPRWHFVKGKDGVLLYEFANPLPIYEAQGAGKSPVVILEATQNHRKLKIPPGATGIRVSENWHQGWRYRLADGPWQVPLKNPDLSMLLKLDRPGPQIVEMQFRPRFADSSAKVTVATLVVLLLLLFLHFSMGKNTAWRSTPVE